MLYNTVRRYFFVDFRGTYNRAVYAPEKKVALERWAEHVEGLISGRPAKIVPMRHKAEVS